MQGYGIVILTTFSVQMCASVRVSWTLYIASMITIIFRMFLYWEVRSSRITGGHTLRLTYRFRDSELFLKGVALGRPLFYLKRIASEYDEELFLTLRYPAVLPQGSSY